jgi:hypothetical protein
MKIFAMIACLKVREPWEKPATENAQRRRRRVTDEEATMDAYLARTPVMVKARAAASPEWPVACPAVGDRGLQTLAERDGA